MYGIALFWKIKLMTSDLKLYSVLNMINIYVHYTGVNTLNIQCMTNSACPCTQTNSTAFRQCFLTESFPNKHEKILKILYIQYAGHIKTMIIFVILKVYCIGASLYHHIQNDVHALLHPSGFCVESKG